MEKELKPCDICHGLADFLEKCQEGLYGKNKKLNARQELEDLLSDRACVEHYVCLPLLRRKSE